MPVPETFLLYGRDDLVVPNPPPGAQINFGNTQNRAVTRTVTLHYTHGWRYNSNDGVHFWIDLDGTLFQNNESQRRWRHVTGGPYFNQDHDQVRNNNANTVRNTSLAVEICRFGKFRAQPNGGGWEVVGYNGLTFSLDANNPEICDYSTWGNPPGSRQFNLWKIPGGTTYQSDGHTFYKVKAAEFDDARNAERPGYPLDILFTEEQYQTLVPWLKSMLEHFRIPKLFLCDPTSGSENPWIDTHQLTLAGQLQAVRDEAIERAASHQGIWGHMNLQGDRFDPGCSLDYYRLKRGISDKWWYPINLGTENRALNYLDPNISANYLALNSYDAPNQLEDYYRANESGETGFYPLGLNRVWHGGIHINPDSAKQIYAMANGHIVAARITNGQVNGSDLAFSRCFVLIKHQVHTDDNGDEISYAADSASTVYSLYMHLAPLTLNQVADGNGGQRWGHDYATLPKWVCHYLIDNPTVAGVDTGGLIYPNIKVELSDHLGDTGLYITAINNNQPEYGPSVHIEVFTTEDPNTFGTNPWSEAANRIVDPTPTDVLADVATLNQLVRDSGGDGIDTVDIKNAAPSLRNYAVQSRSEWSLTDRAQLGHRQHQISQQRWDNFIRPLCFHTDIAADANAPAWEIGPYHGTTTVWHIHPFSFMQWMNERVDRHERILSEQDKSRTAADNSSAGFTPNLEIEDGYVTGFQNLPGANPNELQQNPPDASNPIAQYNEIDYGVRVSTLTDIAALANAPQTDTRFSRILLDALDICADRQHGLQVVEGYVSAGAVQCSKTAHHALHQSGDAVDLRPSNTTEIDWYNLYTSARNARIFVQEYHGCELEMELSADSSTGAPTQQELNAQAAELWQRLQNANDAADPALTAAPAVQHLDQLRLHLNIATPTVASVASLNELRWLSPDGNPTQGPALPGQRAQIEVQVSGVQAGATLDVFVLSEIFSKTLPPDIRDIASLESVYGSRSFDIAEIERHDARPNTVDSFIERLQKSITGVDTSGNTTVLVDWQVPNVISHGVGRFYALAVVASGAPIVAGGTTSEHTVCPVTQTGQIQFPHIRVTAWSTDEGGAARSNQISFRDHQQAFVVVESVALPDGCELRVLVRDMRDNSEVLDRTLNVGPGDATTTVPCPAPNRRREYHASIEVTQAQYNLRVNSGAGLEWVR